MSTNRRRVARVAAGDQGRRHALSVAVAAAHSSLADWAMRSRGMPIKIYEGYPDVSLEMGPTANLLDATGVR